MPERLPRNLSPRAKRQLLTSAAGEVVHVVVELGPSADEARIRDEVAGLGGAVRSWSSGARLLGLDIPAARLGELARLRGVVYVESAEPYGY